MREPWELAWVDYYDALGIEHGARAQEIHAAFRSLARSYHPDRQQGVSDAARADAERRFKEVGDAYAVLRDPERRRAYDLAHARSREGLSPTAQISVDPQECSLTSYTGDVIIVSHLRLPPGLPQALLTVDCDDADAELNSIALHPCAHGDQAVTDATVQLRLHGMRSRTLHLEYRVAAHVAAQVVRVKTVPAPLNWPGRVYRNFGLRGSLVLVGILALLIATVSAGDAGVAGGSAVLALCALGLILAGVGGYIVHFVRTPGWSNKLRPRLNWMTFVGAIILASFVVRVIRALL